MNHLKSACVVALAVVLAACASCTDTGSAPSEVAVRVDPQANPWTHLNLNNDPGNFQFAIVSDRTGGHRPGVFAKAVRRLNLLQPEFVMSIGDLIEGYTGDEAAVNAQRDEFEGLVNRLEMPFFYVPGNHDISNEVMVEKWRERFGRTYYHFVYRGVLFLCLNTEDPPATHISDDQVQYVADALAENPNVRWTLVFMHQPLWTYEEKAKGEANTGWLKVEALLEDRPYTVFAGHLHTYTKYERNDRRYFILATTGGASDLLGPQYGRFDHVVWVTMTDEGPRLANLLLEGIHDENVVTEESQKVLASVLRGASIQIDPVLTEETVFDGATARLTIRNSAEFPMGAAGRFKDTPILSVQPGEFRVTVPPKSEKTIDLKITPEEPTEVNNLSPITLEWNLTLPFPNTEPLELKGTKRIVVEKVLYIKGEFSDDFASYKKDSTGLPVWLPLAGKWKIEDGEYHQLVLQGYDYCTTANAWIRGDYEIEAKVRLVEGTLEGGFLFNMPSRFSKGPSQMVRFSGHETLWCGPFNDEGIFTLEHSVPTDVKRDEEWVTLTVTVHNSRGTYDLAVNGKQVAKDLKLTYVSRADQGRCIGLVGCRGHISYSRVRVTPLSEAR